MPTLKERFSAWERGMRAHYNTDYTTPENAKRARFYMRWLDHEILRHWWTNFEEFAPGAYRSNHPTEKRFRKIADMGVTTILNLRGVRQTPYYFSEVAICEELGLTLISHQMSASIAPTRAKLQGLIEILTTIEHPFVMHCKSGADRTGLASAIYLMVIKGEPVETARRMLSLRSFEDWVDTVYDDADVTATFKAR